MADLPSSTSDLDARAQADDMQKRTRKERRFSRTEADLPDATQHTSYSLLRSLTRKEGASARITDLLSILGTHTPLPAPVESNDSVWLLDNVAYLGPDGQWEAEYVAAVFAQRTSHRISDAVLQVADRLGLSREDPVIATIEKRLVPFLLEIQPGRQVEALHGGYTRITLSPSGRNGITSDVVRLPEAPAGMAVPTTAEVPAGANGLLQAKTFFAAPDGWGIISGKPCRVFVCPASLSLRPDRGPKPLQTSTTRSRSPRPATPSESCRRRLPTSRRPPRACPSSMPTSSRRSRPPRPSSTSRLRPTTCTRSCATSATATTPTAS